MPESRVLVQPVKGRSLKEHVREVLDFCDWQHLVQPGARVVLKPNLCTDRAEMIACANTSNELLDCVCSILKERTDNIVIGESDGTRYKTEAAFENNGVYAICSKYGIKAVNFSRDETLAVPHPLLKGWTFSKTFLEADVFITLPKLKTHATTVFTGALKNQWGCIPRYDRILLHKHLDTLIVAVNKIKKPQITIMDGIIGMEGRGPINGTPVELGILLGGTDPVAVDATAMRIIGLEPYSSKHVALAEKAGLGHVSEKAIEIVGDFASHYRKFTPARKDWAIKLLNVISRSELLTKYLILNDVIFYPIRSVIIWVRKNATF